MSKKKCIIKVFAEDGEDDSVNITVQNMEVEGYETITREIFGVLIRILYPTERRDKHDNS